MSLGKGSARIQSSTGKKQILCFTYAAIYHDKTVNEFGRSACARRNKILNFLDGFFFVSLIPDELSFHHKMSTILMKR